LCVSDDAAFGKTFVASGALGVGEADNLD